MKSRVDVERTLLLSLLVLGRGQSGEMCISLPVASVSNVKSILIDAKNIYLTVTVKSETQSCMGGFLTLRTHKQRGADQCEFECKSVK